jgi:D-sedoheptulose 7-phosphate isomerase
MHDTEAFARGYLDRLKRTLDAVDPAEVAAAVDLVADAWRGGRQVVTLGNGGSALTALHFVNDWNKGVFQATGQPFLGRCLCDNIGLVMAYANDMSYADVFAAQLRTVMRPGDLVVALSSGGESENVLRAVDHANAAGGITLGLCGHRGGRLRAAARHAVWVPADDTQLVEDVFLAFGHIVMQRLCGMTGAPTR